MKRKMFFAERMLYGDGKTPFNAVCPVKIYGSFDIENLNKALKKLQHKHPLLNAGIENDHHGKPWFIVKEDNYPIPVSVIERVNDDDWKTVSQNEWSKPFNIATEPLIRVVWLKGDDVSELLLVFHHCFCDGEGAVTMLTELLQLLDDEEADIGQQYPLLNIKDIIPAAILQNKKKVLKSKLIGKAANLILRLIPVSKKNLVVRGTDYLINWKLDKELGDQLMLKCKAEGVTVNTALCLVVLNAFKEVRKEQFHNKISCPVNIRRFAPQISKDNLFAFGLMLVASAGSEPNFFTDARRLQDDLNKKTEKLDPYGTMMMMEAAHASLNKFTKFLKYGKSSNDCMFSNMGRIAIPHLYQSFTVETIFSPSVIGPLGNTTTLITSTYKGIMDFTFVASEGYIPYNDAVAIKHKIVTIITEQVKTNIKAELV